MVVFEEYFLHLFPLGYKRPPYAGIKQEGRLERKEASTAPGYEPSVNYWM